jgi:cell division protein FtsI (penicillin-binding protein 3)
MNKLKQIYKKWIDNPNYAHRYQLVLFSIVFYILFFVIKTIFVSAIDFEAQKETEKNSVKPFTQKHNRGLILDRNNVVLAGNILVSDVALDPPENLQIVGFDSINSVWRIKKKCNKDKKCWKNLSNNARKLLKNKQKNSKYLELIEFPELIADALKVNKTTLNNTVKSIKTSCKDDNKCIVYKLLAKKLPFTGEKIQNLIKLKQENFLVCKSKKSQKGKIQVIKEKYLGWFFDKKNDKYVIRCFAEKLGGISISSNTKRFYSQAPSTTPIIGAVNSKGVGVFGIESSFEDFLKERIVENENYKKSGSWKNHNKIVVDKKISNNLHLTIDKKIQFVLFNAIKNSVDKHKADNGSGIILNSNGEILAMANYPTSDVNLGINGVDNYSHFVNRTIKDNVDTASTIKPLVALIALEANVLQKSSMLDITKGEGIKKFKTDDTKPFISIADIIKKSHGLGAIKIGKKIDNAKLYEYLSMLGFGRSLNILPQIENIGLLRNFYDWSKVDKKRLSFGGYGVINTTIAQLARSYLIFLNDGKINNLKLFKDTPNEEYQVFSKENIDYITNAMIAGVNDGGTGKLAKLDKFIAAGKTGTAQLLINGKYSNSKHNTMFAGFAPAKNPKYLMVVGVKNPNGYNNTGGKVAAPVFKKVMDNILNIEDLAN